MTLKKKKKKILIKKKKKEKKKINFPSSFTSNFIIKARQTNT